MPGGILERLSMVVLGDGGYLLELERRGYVQAGPFVPEVSLTRPEALAELHREFVDAGAEVIQTLTFYASEDKLGHRRPRRPRGRHEPRGRPDRPRGRRRVSGTKSWSPAT